jgi:hypothetical protein
MLTDLLSSVLNAVQSPVSEFSSRVVAEKISGVDTAAA